MILEEQYRKFKATHDQAPTKLVQPVFSLYNWAFVHEWRPYLEVSFFLLLFFYSLHHVVGAASQAGAASNSAKAALAGHS
jgi:hypothetical protein